MFVNEMMTCNGTYHGLEIELNNARASIKTYYHFFEI